MEKLVIASNNEGKKRELIHLLGDKFEVYTMKDLGIVLDTIEDCRTLKGNSYKKAKELKELVGNEYSVLADDSGLFISALNGRPGVNTARYASDHDDEANMDLVLENLKTANNRYAEFKTILCYMDLDGVHSYFEGVMEITIALEKRGSQGFGYDKILLASCGKTLAEMTEDEKNSISHRGKALRKFLKYTEDLAEYQVYFDNNPEKEIEIYNLENALLKYWKECNISTIYKYKSRIKALSAGRTPITLFYDIHNILFRGIKDMATYNEDIDDIDIDIDVLIANRALRG